MYSVKYKKCLAQLDPKTLIVTVSKADKPTVTYQVVKRLSEKEMRTVINMYHNKYCK